jgi:hypothetical protein
MLHQILTRLLVEMIFLRITLIIQIIQMEDPTGFSLEGFVYLSGKVHVLVRRMTNFELMVNVASRAR